MGGRGRRGEKMEKKGRRERGRTFPLLMSYKSPYPLSSMTTFPSSLNSIEEKEREKNEREEGERGEEERGKERERGERREKREKFMKESEKVRKREN
jgi:hypothetical protein